ncbi:MAG: sulfur oxidation c-type cytochrome SoxX [Epsilonproteobacteria bacterium]|nr:MAG: sulfur oxidation c-type cytochrome SoxX [Campylobacterota bacterium]
MNIFKKLPIVLTISGLVATMGLSNDLVKQGEELFKTKTLGNCIACHDINGKEDIQKMGPGSMGPKLVSLSAWPEKALYDKIYDPYTTNPISQMPAFGKSGWLSKDEINALVAYLKTIN